MLKNCVLVLLLIIPSVSFSQKQYKTPKHSLGVEVNFSASLLSNMRFDIVLIESYSPGFGASFLVPYQYAPKSSFFGFQTGLGFYMWGTRHTTQALSGSPHAPATITSNEKQSMYFLGIPLVSQFKLAKSFWLELGLQSNVPVYHSGVYAEI